MIDFNDFYLKKDCETFLIKQPTGSTWFFNDCCNTLSEKYELRKYYPEIDSKNIAELKIIPTNRCQLDCIYCYTANDRKMNCSSLKFESIKEIELNFLKQNNDCALCFVGGGEPTLNFDIIKKCVMLAEHTNSNVYYKIVTNGVFSDETRQFITKHKFHIAISLDGPYEVMRDQQKGKYNENFYHQSLKNIKSLIIDGAKIIINVVVMLDGLKKNINLLPEICQYFLELNVKKINISLDNMVWDMNLSEVEMNIITEAFIRLLEWVPKNRKMKVSCELLRNRINYLDNKQCNSVFGSNSFSIFPSGSVSYCYNDQSCQVEVISQISDTITALKKTFTNYRSCYCDMCIARQICFVNKCPANFKKYIMKGEGNFCENMNKFRLGLIQYYIDKVTS